MLDTINNMLATHSKIQQSENKSLDLDRNKSDKFSDHVSATDDQSQKERRKPEETASKDDNEQVSQKQSTDKPARKNETENTSDVDANNVSDTGGEEQEVSFETALLLLNEIQEVVEEDVEFVQTTTDEGAGLLEDSSQVGETELGALGDALGDENTALQATTLTGEVKNVLQDGQQQNLNGEGEFLAEEELVLTPKDFQQGTDQNAGKGKQGPQTLDPLQRVGENNGAKNVDAGKNADADTLVDNENGDLASKEQQGTKSAEGTESNHEKKTQARVFNLQSNAAQNAANNVNNVANQADAGLTVTQGNQNIAGATGVNVTQGLSNTQQTQQVPINNLAMHIAGKAQNGVKRFDIQLDPPELGRIDVRLDVTKDGSVNTHIAVERSETLDLMQRDSKALEKALLQAGLDMGEGKMQFSLKEEGFHGEEFDFDEASGQQDDDNAEIEDLTVNVEQIMEMYRQSGGATGLDIRV